MAEQLCVEWGIEFFGDTPKSGISGPDGTLILGFWEFLLIFLVTDQFAIPLSVNESFSPSHICSSICCLLFLNFCHFNKSFVLWAMNMCSYCFT